MAGTVNGITKPKHSSNRDSFTYADLKFQMLVAEPVPKSYPEHKQAAQDLCLSLTIYYTSTLSVCQLNVLGNTAQML